MAGETNPNRMRDDEIYAKRMRGAKLDELAAEYGVHRTRISQIVQSVAKSLPERDRSELLALSVSHLEDIREKVIDLFNLQPPPVTAGNMGMTLIDPETGAVVRDYSLRRSTIDQLLKVDAALAKRLGLDAPAQSEVRASVQYQIEGIDPEDLK